MDKHTPVHQLEKAKQRAGVAEAKPHERRSQLSRLKRRSRPPQKKKGQSVASAYIQVRLVGYDQIPRGPVRSPRTELS
jgi:hypothetical protein